MSFWARLSAAARRERGTPEGVGRGLIRDFLQVDIDRKLDAAVGADVRRSGFLEEDAVRRVREYRKRARIGQAGRVREPSRRYRRARRSYTVWDR